MKRLDMNAVNLTGCKLTAKEKQAVTGGVERIDYVLCACGTSGPIWYAGCLCPSSGCIAYSPQSRHPDCLAF